MPNAHAVEIDGLVKQYGGTRALDGVSLTVEEGEIVVLLGLSGSGKSTLLRHINQLDVPTAGNVRVLGEDVAALRGKRLRSLRSRIGVVFQQFELVGSLSVLENVLTGSLARLKGPRMGTWMYPKELRTTALGHLDRVGLGGREHQRADTLSGGQQQRVAIARALMQSPEILLADEPVASLDPESSQQVMDLIREIGRERGLTVLCCLHQVELAMSWGDRLVGLRGGKVVLDTPTAGIDKDSVMRIYRAVAPDVPAELVAQDTTTAAAGRAAS
ncbi:phosphonate ABC transporter ATP-binding protein [Arthrobacter alkaliphilus]|uniref:phosphonate ABC transporter ATP-binding protein n=1 Tax=Arthrobacter alkaliphilus TaxID=369936 RepID=UPI001F336631|nr:phosphonate ABC transporter ATP-binding protein [Arthrobacter alkaliphilus]